MKIIVRGRPSKGGLSMMHMSVRVAPPTMLQLMKEDDDNDDDD